VAEPFFCLRYTPKTISGVWTGNLLSNLLIKRHRPLVGRLQTIGPEASFGDLPFGHYDIEVSAVGYITDHKELQVISALNSVKLEIVLQRDPAAFKLDVDEALPTKARKETKHAVSALKSGNLKQAERWLDAAYQLAPDNADLNFLMDTCATGRRISSTRRPTWERRQI